MFSHSGKSESGKERQVKQLKGHFGQLSDRTAIMQTTTLRTLRASVRMRDEGVVMHKAWILALLLAPSHSPLTAQALLEGIHSEAQGESSVCGIAGSNALDIRDALRSDPTINEEPSPSERFETYFSSTESKQWTVTTKADAAYPAVTCVHLFTSDGGTDMLRQMRCDASRDACDALFLEFRAHDDGIRKQLRGQ